MAEKQGVYLPATAATSVNCHKYDSTKRHYHDKNVAYKLLLFISPVALPVFAQNAIRPSTSNRN
jgi:hypothetical protein